MDFLDKLNAKIERNRASDREVAKAVGTTVAAMDRDITAPDPGHIGAVVGQRGNEPMNRKRITTAESRAAADRAYVCVNPECPQGLPWWKHTGKPSQERCGSCGQIVRETTLSPRT